MKAAELTEALEGLQKAVYTVQDIARITGKGPAYLNVYLHRLKTRGVLEEVERGTYALNYTDPMLIASGLLFPSYLSFMSGLRFYNLTTQLPRTVLVACATSKKEIRKQTYGIQFVRLKKSRLFGYTRERMYGNKVAVVGELEKVIVDSLLLPQYCPIDETFGALVDGKPNTERLVQYALRMDSTVLLKRLGYLLERAGTDVYGRLKGRLSRRYDRLNPFLPPGKKRERRWKLMINQELEE